MEEEKKTEPNVISYRMEFIRMKSLAILALKHLESVEGEDIPEDVEFRQVLWTLVAEFTNRCQHFARIFYGTLGLPGVDDRAYKQKEV
jgi:hypothetical protein